MGALTTRLGSDCQAIVRCLATNLNVAVRNGMQCIGARCWHDCCPETPCDAAVVPAVLSNLNFRVWSRTVRRVTPGRSFMRRCLADAPNLCGPAGGAIYLVIMSRTLAGSCAAVTSLLWLVALRYGAFQRRSQRLFQDALADTGQVAEEVRS